MVTKTKKEPYNITKRDSGVCALYLTPDGKYKSRTYRKFTMSQNTNFIYDHVYPLFNNLRKIAPREAKRMWALANCASTGSVKSLTAANYVEAKFLSMMVDSLNFFDFFKLKDPWGNVSFNSDLLSELRVPNYVCYLFSLKSGKELPLSLSFEREIKNICVSVQLQTYGKVLDRKSYDSSIISGKVTNAMLLEALSVYDEK